ncbi:hypothetical protein PVAP13_3KG089981 [Panicum virgatum]|uniref:Uncharacterized protein n=1 Tax=Panicum virgatum TaxID=38727 RepID=A0A8T0V5R7_PANVG|nr:hypothetical protein PVAP13_3KG089981 [Panicum virgatum]
MRSRCFISFCMHHRPLRSNPPPPPPPPPPRRDPLAAPSHPEPPSLRASWRTRDRAARARACALRCARAEQGGTGAASPSARIGRRAGLPRWRDLLPLRGAACREAPRPAAGRHAGHAAVPRRRGAPRECRRAAPGHAAAVPLP